MLDSSECPGEKGRTFIKSKMLLGVQMYFLVFEMFVLFHPEVSLHSWLLWPTVRWRGKQRRKKAAAAAQVFFCRAYASYVLKNLEVTFFFAFAHFLLYTKDPDLLQALDLPVMPASAAPARRRRRRRRCRRRLCLLLLKAKVTLKLTWRRRRGRRRYSRSRGSKAFFIDSPPPAASLLLQPPLVTKAFQSRPPWPWPRSTTGPNVKTRQKLRFEKFMKVTGYKYWKPATI